MVDLGFAIYSRYLSSDGADGSVGYAAHLGGAAAGFLVGMNVLRNFKTMVLMLCFFMFCFICLFRYFLSLLPAVALVAFASASASATSSASAAAAAVIVNVNYTQTAAAAGTNTTTATKSVFTTAVYCGFVVYRRSCSCFLSPFPP